MGLFVLNICVFLSSFLEGVESPYTSGEPYKFKSYIFTTTVARALDAPLPHCSGIYHTVEASIAL